MDELKPQHALEAINAVIKTMLDAPEEQQARIDALRAQVSALKTENAQLKAELAMERLVNVRINCN